MDKITEEIFKKVYEFHGHVCLMSTAGTRIALSAMNAIKLKKSDVFLFAFYHARTCAVDPIQVITGCTLGNSNILVVDEAEKNHTLELVRQSDGIGVSATLKEEILEEMKECMMKKKRRESGCEIDFNNMLEKLKNADEDSIVEVKPFKMDIKPYLKY